MTRLAWRRLWFQVHKWIGLALMAVLMPLALSGSLLLAHDWLGERPGARPAVAPPPLPLSRYLAAARAALPPGARVAALAMPGGAGPALIVRAAPPGAPGPRRSPPLRLAIDPARAAVLPGGAVGGDGAWRTLHRFHGSLMLPGIGRAIVGWLGVAMLASALSGLWLWWPVVGRVARGLRWRRGPGLDHNLHHLIGFWIALPLAVVSLSGAWISFPAFFAGLAGEPAPRRVATPLPVAVTRQPIDAVAARFAGRGTLAELALPAGDRPRWVATMADGRRLAMDDATGAFAAVDRPRQGQAMRLMRMLHEGDRETGPAWRAIVLLAGLAPSLLGVTGLVMWWRARRWRGRMAR